MKKLSKVFARKTVSGGACVKQKKLKRGVLALLGAVMAVSLAGAGISYGLPVNAMSSAGTTTVAGGDIWDATANKFKKQQLQTLVSQITGGGRAYSDLSEKLSNASGNVLTSANIHANNGNKDIIVEFGGQKWTVTYVSNNNTNEIVATLWYAGPETDTYSISDRWISDADVITSAHDGYTRYSNHYGGSYMRAVTLNNGGFYWTTNSNLVKDDNLVNKTRAIQSASNDFAMFTMREVSGSVSSFLEVPVNMPWQQNQRNTNISATRYGNENLVRVSDGWNHNNINLAQDDPLYFQWGYDKVWLPSISETGNGTVDGIWVTTQNQRASASTSAWTRSGYTDKAFGGYVLTSAGKQGGGGNTSNKCGLRPAIHLNLTKAFASVGYDGADDLYNDAANKFNRPNLDRLYSQLGAANYSALESKVSGGANITAQDIARLNNHQGDVTVQFGGFNWTVTYVSQTTTGDVIATLWYDDVEDGSEFSKGWRSNTGSGGYAGYTKHSSHYGGSYLRAIALGNGGQYYHSDKGEYVQLDSDVITKTATAAEAQASKFYTFAQGDLAQYLAAPNSVEWQQDQKESFKYSNFNRLQNETLVKVTDNWFSENLLNSQDDPLYFNWGNDKVWLPSLSETGWDAQNGGIWETSVSQRSNNYQGNGSSDSKYSWTRSGVQTIAHPAYVLDSSGVTVARSTTFVLGVRPAIHLNLTKAESNTGGNSFADLNKELQDKWNAAIEESLYNGGKQVAFTLTDNWLALPDKDYKTSFGKGVGFSNGGLYIPAGANIVFDLNGRVLDRNLAVAAEIGNAIWNDGTLIINDSSSNGSGTVRGAYSKTDIGAAICNYGYLIINGGNFVDNATVDGGGPAVFSRGCFVINGGTFANNVTVNGCGGAFVIVGSAEFNGGVITHNKANLEVGGAIFIYINSYVVINDVEVCFNETGSHGAVNINNGSSVIVNGGKFHNNYAKSQGGAFVTRRDATLEINGGEITENVAYAHGGAICSFAGSEIIINDGLIKGNCVDDLANGYGGAINVAGKLTINGGEISYNKSSRGGAFYALGTDIVMNGGVLKNNIATRYGGAVYVSDGYEFTLNGGEICYNTATGEYDGIADGGGIFINGNKPINEAPRDATFKMNGGAIYGNKAFTAGGGVMMMLEGSHFNLTGGVIKDNTLTDGTTKSNLFLAKNSNVITVNGRLNTRSTYIGISLESERTTAVTSGYTSAGNAAGDVSKYFFADNGKTVSVTSNEVVITTTNAAAKTDAQWSYTRSGSSAVNIPKTASYYSVEYTGNAFTVACSAGGNKGVDSLGRPVTVMTEAGKYYFTANNAATLNNPVLIFEILPQSIAGATVTVESKEVYNGKAHTPEVKVELDGKVLVKDKDYTLEYAANINAGTASVTVRGAGNYGGSVMGSFEIEQRNIEIRWGKLEAEYDGAVKAVYAEAEGVLAGESVSILLNYAFGGRAITPVNAGTYTVYGSLSASGNYKLAPTANRYETFVIKPKTVEAVWSGLEFTYNGEEQAPTATYKDITNKTLSLNVTVGGAHTGANVYTAAATSPDSNYVVSAASANVQFEIKKKAVAPAWGANTHAYDGVNYTPSVTLNDIDGNDLSAGTAFEYFKNGVSIGNTAPANQGKYVVRLTLTNANYCLADDSGKAIEYYDYEYTITPSAANGSWTFADPDYDGQGKAPQFAYTDSSETLTVTLTYGVDKGDGTADKYTADLPVNAGNYVVKAVFENGNYDEILHPFTIGKKQVSVAWTGDKDSVSVSNGYKWLYDGKEHAPTATASVAGVAGVTDLEITVAGKTDTGNYTATAVLKDTELNKNFTLTGETENYEIAHSTITAVKWYNYGSDTPVTGKPSYQYISVFGRPGPNLSAYGVATMQGPDESGSTVTRTVEVPMKVSYIGSFNPSGYWNIGTYTAQAAVSNSNSSTALTGTALQLEFDVTEKQLETTVATIVWEFVSAQTDDDTGAKYWIYDGQPHAPEARRVIPDKTYDPDDASTYEVLKTGGARTDAGTYYAYIMPCNYEIAESDADCEYEIRPREITVTWAGVGGAANNFEWTYDGLAHAPVATANGSGGLTVTLEAITEYVNAGEYVAVAKAGGNFKITSGETQSFKIKQLVLDPDDVVWTGKDGSTTDFKWTADGSAHAPAAALTVTINGSSVTVSLTVTGATSAVGVHTAYATLDSSDTANANFVLKNASKEFSIETSAIRAIMWEGTESGDALVFVYNGKEQTPKAYYWDSENNKVYLNVVGGATEAGEYIAYVTDETGLTAGMSLKYTIKAQELTVSWDKTTATYDGAEHAPEAAFADADGNTVTLTLGTDYKVTAFTTAGTHESEIVFLNKNYAAAGTTGSAEFMINPKKITITWVANDDGTFNFMYDGTAKKPSFNSSESGVTVTVLGEETAVGTYTATAVCDDNNYYLSDSAHKDKAEHEFNVIPFAISVDWKGNGGDPDNFSYEYDGNTYFAPTATYTDWNGDEQTLTVRGERMDAGKNYQAVAVLPENCSFKFTSGEHAGTHSFEITPKLITGIVWEGVDGSATVFAWTYSGKPHSPVAKTPEGDVLSVTGAAADVGEYTATAGLPNASNYKFDESVDPDIKFTIVPKTVDVKWYGKDGSETDFVWDYTGSLICPEAKFEDVNGTMVEVPVNGGAAAAGQHIATAEDIFANYDFSEVSLTQTFTVNAKTLTLSWSDSDKIKDGVYTYVYNGKVQMPVATSAEGINLSYTILDAEGNPVGAVVGAGEYTVTVSPADMNYTIPADDKTVNVEITKKTVTVEWGSDSLAYTGGAIAPEAWFVDADNQCIALAVTGAETEPGTDYTATADFVSPNANYVLDTDSASKTYEIVKKTEDELVWDWANGEWKVPGEEPEEPPVAEG